MKLDSWLKDNCAGCRDIAAGEVLYIMRGFESKNLHVIGTCEECEHWCTDQSSPDFACIKSGPKFGCIHFQPKGKEELNECN